METPCSKWGRHRGTPGCAISKRRATRAAPVSWSPGARPAGGVNGKNRPSGRPLTSATSTCLGPSVSKDSDQTEAAPRKFKLGHLGNLNQVIKALGVTIRAMADGTLDSQVGARICNGLGILRACLEMQKLEQLEARMDDITDRVARNRTAAAQERHP